jgi:hypothetical protein
VHDKTKAGRNKGSGSFARRLSLELHLPQHLKQNILVPVAKGASQPRPAQEVS